MTTTVVEVPATDPPVQLGVLVPGVAEAKLRRIVSQSQSSLSDVAASWIAAGDQDAPVPADAGAGLSIFVPAGVAAAVRAEAQRRGLEPGQVAAARLAAVAGRS
jgi:hypothetical protein